MNARFACEGIDVKGHVPDRPVGDVRVQQDGALQAPVDEQALREGHGVRGGFGKVMPSSVRV